MDIVEQNTRGCWRKPHLYFVEFCLITIFICDLLRGWRQNLSAVDQ